MGLALLQLPTLLSCCMCRLMWCTQSLDCIPTFALPCQPCCVPCADLFPEGVVIPVLRGILPDFDVVYAPLISSYGSCTGAVLDTRARLTPE